mmetsp:Transcript_8738/g.10943  ORF Transcript_8738/g.10943 Transcript_8738/m.10943 type:complete len:153 (+) Transcript_8738:49-507(+)
MFPNTARRLLFSQLRKTPTARCFSSADKEFLVINAVGPDRLGIVSGLTELVVEKGGNVGESQASRLGSHFGLMMLVSVPKSATQELQDAVKALEGMSTSCYPTEDPTANRDSPSVGYSGHFTLSGLCVSVCFTLYVPSPILTKKSSKYVLHL